jgi:hypothetical protein
MRYVVIDPSTETVPAIDCASFDEAITAAGLELGRVDHGQLTRDLGSVFFEFGMFEPPEQQHYTALGRRLLAGRILIYGVGYRGETVDVEVHPTNFEATFLHGASDVEEAIGRGLIERPEIRMSGEVVWQWPDPIPFDQPNQGRGASS